MKELCLCGCLGLADPILITLDNWCPNCGHGHVDLPGDDSTCRCISCGEPLPRSVALKTPPTRVQIRRKAGARHKKSVEATV